jgi:hypothetical protein
VESCVSACQSQMFTIAGLEYAKECCMSDPYNDEMAQANDDWCLFVIRVW